MNILIFNWRCPRHPWAGGAERYLYEISKRLIKKGHRVSWFVSHWKGLKKKEIIEGIEIIRKGGIYSVYLHALFYYFEELKKKNFDIIIDNINGVPFFTPLFIHKPKIAIIHHLVQKIFFKELPFHLATVGWLSEKIIPILYRNTSFITVSKSSKKEMKNFGIKDIIKIVPNGIDLFPKLNPNPKSPNPIIISLGRLKRYKRLDYLLKAFKIVLQSEPHAKLWIVGSGRYEGQLKKLTKELHLQDHVKFFGFVDENKKLKLLKKAWVFVSPSEKEGWGITIIEANACGTPCIAYDVPGLRDSIQDSITGILIKENGNVEKLAEAIYKLLVNHELRKELSQNAIEWAKQFSWDKSAEEFEKILEDILQKK